MTTLRDYLKDLYLEGLNEGRESTPGDPINEELLEAAVQFTLETIKVRLIG